MNPRPPDPQAKTYTVRIKYGDQRKSFPLGVGSKRAAGKQAKDIYLSLVSKGWEFTLAEYHPNHSKPRGGVVTVGDFIREVEAFSDVVPRTFAEYARSFRRIVADIEKITDEKTVVRKRRVEGKLVETKEVVSGRFDYMSGGREDWLKQVEGVPLSRITPEKVTKWKLAHVKDSLGDPIEERHKKNSANSIIRQAKALFSKSNLRHISGTIQLPSPLPFEDVEYFPRSSTRYISKIDAAQLLVDAKEELAEAKPEAFKIMLLGMCAGLRRKEIDTLLWTQVDFQGGQIHIETTPYFKPKSEDSAGSVELEPEVLALFRGYRARATGLFVIESDRQPKPQATYSYARAEKHFADLYEWLEEKGVDDAKPLHTLRKEYGSIICQNHGLYAASRALRHADVQITAQHYLDKKERVTVGLGSVLSDKVTQFESEKAAAENE